MDVYNIIMKYDKLYYTYINFLNKITLKYLLYFYFYFFLYLYKF